MSSLPTLIQLADKKLDDAQKHLAELAAEIERVQLAQQKLYKDAEGAHELAQQTDHPLAYKDAGHAAMYARQQATQLEAVKEMFRQKHADQLDLIRQLFAEKKRYEVLHEAQQQEAKKRRETKQQAMLEDLTNRPR